MSCSQEVVPIEDSGITLTLTNHMTRVFNAEQSLCPQYRHLGLNAIYNLLFFHHEQGVRCL